MNYNFDELIDRRETSAEKVEGMKSIWGREDLIPMWVADMDFATPPFVIDAIRKRCEHPVLAIPANLIAIIRPLLTGWIPVMV